MARPNNQGAQVQAKMAALQSKVNRAKNLALQDYARGELQDIERRITVAKTDPSARAWAPWAWSTRRQRTREGTAGRGLLYKTGALLRSFRATIKDGAVSIASALNYANFLQRGRANMRPRVIVDLGSKLSRNRLLKSLSKHMKGLQ